MEGTTAVLTVFFEKETGFWVGIYERRDSGFLEVSKTVFGAEPSLKEVHAFLLADWSRMCFGRSDGPSFIYNIIPPHSMRDVPSWLAGLISGMEGSGVWLSTGRKQNQIRK